MNAQGFAECASGAFPGLWHTLAIRTRPSWRRAHRNVFTWMEDLRQKAERSDIVTNYAPGDERADNVLDLCAARFLLAGICSSRLQGSSATKVGHDGFQAFQWRDSRRALHLRRRRKRDERDDVVM